MANKSGLGAGIGIVVGMVLVLLVVLGLVAAAGFVVLGRSSMPG